MITLIAMFAVAFVVVGLIAIALGGNRTYTQNSTTSRGSRDVWDRRF